jgi:hypothetical protein
MVIRECIRKYKLCGATRELHVLLLAGLRVDPCAASPGVNRHGMGAGSGTHDSLALAENRRRGATQCSSHRGEFLQCVSLEKSFRYCLGCITLLRQRPAKKIYSLISPPGERCFSNRNGSLGRTHEVELRQLNSQLCDDCTTSSSRLYLPPLFFDSVVESTCGAVV